MIDDLTLLGWRRLSCAVLVRALLDTRSKNGAKAAREAGLPPGLTLAGDARSFLRSDGARWLVLALDLDPAGLDQALGELATPSSSSGSTTRSGARLPLMVGSLATSV